MPEAFFDVYLSTVSFFYKYPSLTNGYGFFAKFLDNSETMSLHCVLPSQSRGDIQSISCTQCLQFRVCSIAMS